MNVTGLVTLMYEKVKSTMANYVCCVSGQCGHPREKYTSTVAKYVLDRYPGTNLPPPTLFSPFEHVTSNMANYVWNGVLKLPANMADYAFCGLVTHLKR